MSEPLKVKDPEERIRGAYTIELRLSSGQIELERSVEIERDLEHQVKRRADSQLVGEKQAEVFATDFDVLRSFEDREITLVREPCFHRLVQQNGDVITSHQEGDRRVENQLGVAGLERGDEFVKHPTAAEGPVVVPRPSNLDLGHLIQYGEERLGLIDPEKIHHLTPRSTAAPPRHHPFFFVLNERHGKFRLGGRLSSGVQALFPKELVLMLQLSNRITPVELIPGNVRDFHS